MKNNIIFTSKIWIVNARNATLLSGEIFSDKVLTV